MDLKEFEKQWANMQDTINDGYRQDIPRIVGVEAVNHFKQGFEDEGFTDRSLKKWPEVKRRMIGTTAKGAAGQRKILTGPTGNLKDSIDYSAEPNKTVVFANPQNKGASANYAVPHNFGANNAGRSRNVVIPKRQFIGKSVVLESKLTQKIQSWIVTKINQFMK